MVRRKRHCSLGDWPDDNRPVELIGGPDDGDLIGEPFRRGDRTGRITLIAPASGRDRDRAVVFRHYLIRPCLTRADYVGSELFPFVGGMGHLKAGLSKMTGVDLSGGGPDE